MKALNSDINDGDIGPHNDPGEPGDPAVPNASAPAVPLGRRIVRAASANGVSSLLTLLLSALAGLAVARHHGPEGYGEFVTANMLIFVSSMICECGLPLALSKQIARYERDGDHDIVPGFCTTVIALAAGIALLYSSAMCLSLPWLESYLHVFYSRGFVLTFPLALAGAVIGDCTYGVYSALLRARAVLAVSVSGPAAMVLYIVAYRCGAPLPLWGAVTIGYFMAGVVAGGMLGRDRLLGRPLAWRYLAPLRVDVVPAVSFIYLTVFSTWSDRWVVGTQLGPEAMGLYAAAVAIIQAGLRLPTNLAQLVVPVSARVETAARERSRFNGLMLYTFSLFSTGIVLVLLAAGGGLLRLLFGPGFAPAAAALLLMTPSVLAAAVTLPLLSALTGSQRSHLVTVLLGITTPARFALLLYMTHRWGLPGTALATASMDCVLAASCAAAAHRTGLPFPLAAFLTPVGAGAAALAIGLAARILGAPPLLVSVVSLVSFGGIAAGLWFHSGRFRVQGA